LAGKPGGKWALEISRRKWEDNIKMGPKKLGWEGVVRIHLAQDFGPVPGFHKIRGVRQALLTHQEGPCFLDLIFGHTNKCSVLQPMYSFC
jgi:hypothetical protein